MNPWEETWTWDDQHRLVASAPDPDPEERQYRVVVETDGGYYPPKRGPERQLIAAAPDMARVLLSLEWSGSDEEGSHCPSCHASAYGKPVHDADGRYLHCETGVHEPSCAWVAALRKAGVR